MSALPSLILTIEQQRSWTVLLVEHRESILALPGVRWGIGSLSEDECIAGAPVLFNVLNDAITNWWHTAHEGGEVASAAVKCLEALDWHVKFVRAVHEGKFTPPTLN